MATVSALECQHRVEARWRDLVSVLKGEIGTWSYNGVIRALHILQNEGSMMCYEMVSDSETVLVVKCSPFRGYPRQLSIDLEEHSISE